MEFEGKPFNLGIGLTNVEKQNLEAYFKVGSQVTFSYRALSKNGIPKEARFVRVRPDE